MKINWGILGIFGVWKQLNMMIDQIGDIILRSTRGWRLGIQFGQINRFAINFTRKGTIGSLRLGWRCENNMQVEKSDSLKGDIWRVGWYERGSGKQNISIQGLIKWMIENRFRLGLKVACACLYVQSKAHDKTAMWLHYKTKTRDTQNDILK